MNKKVILTGVSGQAGSYLSRYLLDKGGFEVYGIKRRSSSLNTERIDDIFDHPNFNLEYGDLADQASIDRVIDLVKPDLFFNLGAQSHVAVSNQLVNYTLDITGSAVGRILESLRQRSPHTHFLQASSSEQFGGMTEKQDITTKFHPRSPYACAKLMAHSLVINYRESYGMHCSNAICYNYESPKRGETFATRKITRAAARIKLGLQNSIKMGLLTPRRDWSHCSDIVDGMFKIATAEKASDYILSSQENYSIEQFLDLAFSKLNLNYKDYIEYDEKYLRPAEVETLLGDSSIARKELGWKPKYTFDQLVSEMVDSDLALAEQELLIKTHKESK